MSDMRTIINIPANQWVKVVNEKTTARIKRKDSSADYFSLIFDNVGDVPVDGIFPDTAERIFTKDDVVFLNSTIPVYIWIACKNGKSGKVQITQGP